MRATLNNAIPVADERLSSAASLKRFLKIETERLRIRHRLGAGGIEVAEGRSHLIDLTISRACRAAAAAGEFAAVALGGYGRRELAPFSDVDLLFLYQGKQTERVKKAFEQVLYLMWDAGLVVGHSFRSVSECLSMARSDLHTRTALSTARLIAGDADLFRELIQQLDSKVFNDSRDNQQLMEAICAEIESRHEKFGTVCVQEPNVKESAGGLRDLHTVLWAGHALFGAASLEKLREAGRVAEEECRAALRDYDFIARVRNEAHFTTGRRADLLTLDLQPEIASSLGYKAERGLIASETFMRDYYRRASRLHSFSRSFLSRSIPSRGEKRFFALVAPRGEEKELAGGFSIQRGKLHLKGESAEPLAAPMKLMEVFSIAQQEAVELSDPLRLAIEGNLHQVSRSFRASREAGQAFLHLLRRRGGVGRALRMMHDTGFLGRLMPEFARITFLVQHDFYHRYTIDEHSLKAVENLDRLSGEQSGSAARLSSVFEEIEDPASLYLGMLLHDIGKGRGGSHVPRGVQIARRVCDRLQLDDRSAGDVVFLVQHHLLMSHLAERRDISEESLIEKFVGTVGDRDRLNKLLLLTYADTSAVGPGVWNEWKAGLLWELYKQARACFTEERPAAQETDRAALFRQKVSRKLLPDFLPSEVERHFAMMPERYARANKADQIARHIRLIHRMGDDSMAADWQQIEERHCTEMVVCARDCEGLFARVAGTLTAHGVNILSADLYTREDGIILDTFKLSQMTGHPVRAEHWSRIEQSIRSAIEGQRDVAAGVQEWLARHGRRKPKASHQRHPSARFDSETSAASTIIEVKAGDEPGLAYRIAAALAALHININFARITTEKNRALDIFYVTDAAGRKLSSKEMNRVEWALMEALSREKTKPIKEAI
jgi:[protein-PII] uridylyltransferase